MNLVHAKEWLRHSFLIKEAALRRQKKEDGMNFVRAKEWLRHSFLN